MNALGAQFNQFISNYKESLQEKIENDKKAEVAAAEARRRRRRQ